MNCYPQLYQTLAVFLGQIISLLNFPVLKGRKQCFSLSKGIYELIRFNVLSCPQGINDGSSS